MAIADLINPKTGDAKRAAYEARAAAEGHGKDETGQEFAELQVVTGKFGRRVGGYIGPVFEIVENNLDSVTGLRQALPLIDQMLGQMVQVTALTKADKRKATRALMLLRGFVQKHAQFSVRAKQALKNVARQKVTDIKQNFIENLKGSDSVVKRFIGERLDRRFGEAAKERKGAMLQAQAQHAESMLPEDESIDFGKGGRGMMGGRGSLGAMRQGGVAAGKDGANTRILNGILQTDKGILKQVTELAKSGKQEADAETKQAELQEEAVDRSEQVEQAGERLAEEKSADTGKPKPGAIKLVEKVAKKTGLSDIFESVMKVFSGENGLLGIFGKLKNVFGMGGLLGSLKGLLPALGVLGQGAAVVGTLFVSWKIGSWISKMIGLGDSAEALSAIMDTSSQSLASTFAAAGPGFIEAAKKRFGFGKTQEQLAAEDEINEAWNKYGGKDKFNKKEYMSLATARRLRQEGQAAARAAAAARASGIPAPTASDITASGTVPGNVPANANITASGTVPGNVPANANITASGTVPAPAAKVATAAPVAVPPASNVQRAAAPQLAAGTWVASEFGQRQLKGEKAPRMHYGLDIAAVTGSAVHAAESGTVEYAGYKDKIGNHIVIKHKNGMKTRYGHLSAMDVKAGEEVNIGDVIGKVGATGGNYGPHLHYEVHQGGVPINPRSATGVLPFQSIVTTGTNKGSGSEMVKAGPAPNAAPAPGATPATAPALAGAAPTPGRAAGNIAAGGTISAAGGGGTAANITNIYNNSNSQSVTTVRKIDPKSDNVTQKAVQDLTRV